MHQTEEARLQLQTRLLLSNMQTQAPTPTKRKAIDKLERPKTYSTKDAIEKLRKANKATRSTKPAKPAKATKSTKSKTKAHDPAPEQIDIPFVKSCPSVSIGAVIWNLIQKETYLDAVELVDVVVPGIGLVKCGVVYYTLSST